MSSVLTHAQLQQEYVNKIVGDWKGSSLCQIKNSPCHDEIVVYHITKGNTADSITVQANKIVNGVEEDMGILHFRVNAEKNEFTSDEYKSLWRFTLKDAKLHGTLMHGDVLYRIIELAKIK